MANVATKTNDGSCAVNKTTTDACETAQNQCNLAVAENIAALKKGLSADESFKPMANPETNARCQELKDCDPEGYKALMSRFETASHAAWTKKLNE